MRLHRFFIDQPLSIGEIVISNADLAHQLKSVFRAVAGYRFILFDNSGFEFEATMLEILGTKIAVEITSQKESLIVPKKILTLFFALPKKDKFEWILEKGTEIGVSVFVPVISDRTEKKNIRMDRAVKIIQEASEQCGRVTLPEIEEPLSLEKVLESDMAKIAFDAGGEKIWNPESLPYEIGVLVGPEGGWTEQEKETIKSSGIDILSLGDQTLRAETACLAVSSLILLG